jgi:hypothetical protein
MKKWRGALAGTPLLDSQSGNSKLLLPKYCPSSLLCRAFVCALSPASPPPVGRRATFVTNAEAAICRRTDKARLAT